MAGGGLSGPLLFKRTLEMATVLAPFGLPLIATGGICTADQIVALQQHGVAVVGMATQLVTDPFQIVRINHQLQHPSKLG